MNQYTDKQIEDTLNLIDSTILNCEKIQPKLKEGTPQFSLTRNRIKALYISEPPKDSVLPDTKVLQMRSASGSFLYFPYSVPLLSSIFAGFFCLDIILSQNLCFDQLSLSFSI